LLRTVAFILAGIKSAPPAGQTGMQSAMPSQISLTIVLDISVFFFSRQVSFASNVFRDVCRRIAAAAF
jgi:hypothetical protein